MKQNALIAGTIAVLLLIAITAFIPDEGETGIESCPSTNTIDSNISLEPGEDFPLTGVTYGTAAIKVPAVDNEGNGVVTHLIITSKAGEGRTLVNINQLLFWVDTQFSIQTAKAVAGNYTDTDFSEIDLLYSIDTEAYLIEGPSAGAALTVGTVSALYNQSLNESVMITGTISPDGTIGQVGGIIEKAGAAKDVGASLFLVPEGQGTEVSYRPKRKCENIGPITYCTTEYEKQEVNIEERVGVEIEEVSDIEDALKYFIG